MASRTDFSIICGLAATTFVLHISACLYIFLSTVHFVPSVQIVCRSAPCSPVNKERSLPWPFCSLS